MKPALTRSKKPSTTLVAVRLTLEELRKLEALSKAFGDNKSEAIRFCLNLVKAPTR